MNNYFRVEEFSESHISFVDGIGSNTGYFKLDNLLNNSTTAAHEFGHTLGLLHPEHLDIRGKGAPGIMYPRGTIVDPHFQYDPDAEPAATGGTMNPFHRKVLQPAELDGKIVTVELPMNSSSSFCGSIGANGKPGGICIAMPLVPAVARFIPHTVTVAHRIGT